jgi:hypothetical protein
MDMTLHESRDWCHLCGERKDGLADIWYAENAEHGGPNTQYIRICRDCSARIFVGITEDVWALPGGWAGLMAGQG